jgi:hypothetical protein
MKMTRLPQLLRIVLERDRRAVGWQGGSCLIPVVCAQCMATAATATAAATGLRAWAAAQRPAWLTEGRLKALTVALLSVAVLAAGTWAN